MSTKIFWILFSEIFALMVLSSMMSYSSKDWVTYLCINVAKLMLAKIYQPIRLRRAPWIKILHRDIVMNSLIVIIIFLPWGIVAQFLYTIQLINRNIKTYTWILATIIFLMIPLLFCPLPRIRTTILFFRGNSQALSNSLSTWNIYKAE